VIGQTQVNIVLGNSVIYIDLDMIVTRFFDCYTFISMINCDMSSSTVAIVIFVPVNVILV